MSDDRAKTPRTLLIADHLWEAFALMAEEMGADRDALLNQALYTFARLNGFLLPADLARLGAVPQPGLTDSARLRVVPPPAEDRRRGGGPARVDELADELESGSIPPPVPSPPPVEDAEAPPRKSMTSLRPRRSSPPAWSSQAAGEPPAGCAPPSQRPKSRAWRCRAGPRWCCSPTAASWTAWSRIASSSAAASTAT